jgi:hypothetical protein
MFTAAIFHLFVKLNLQIRMHPHTMLQLLKYSGFQFLAQTTDFFWKRSTPFDLLFMAYWVLLFLGKSEQCTTLLTHLHVLLWKTSITVQIPTYLQVTLPPFHYKRPILCVFISTAFHLFIKLKPYNKMHILLNASTYCASILKRSSYFMQLSISLYLKSDYFQIIFIPERIQHSNLCVSLRSVFLVDRTLSAGFVSCEETHMSVNIFHLCFWLRVIGCITSCSVMTERLMLVRKMCSQVSNVSGWK